MEKLAKKNKFKVSKYEFSNDVIQDVESLDNKLQNITVFDDYIGEKNLYHIIICQNRINFSAKGSFYAYV